MPNSTVDEHPDKLVAKTRSGGRYHSYVIGGPERCPANEFEVVWLLLLAIGTCVGHDDDQISGSPCDRTNRAIEIPREIENQSVKQNGSRVVTGSCC
jgi:hypothetical protein